MNKKGTPQNLKPFKKGGPGGPGAPKKLPELDKLLADILGEEKDGITEAEVILKKISQMARSGDLRAAEVLLDRGYGKPRQSIQHSGSIENRQIVYEQQPGNESIKD